MGACVHRVDRYYVQQFPPGDAIESIAALASVADPRKHEGDLELLGLALGFAGAYLVENHVIRYQGRELRGAQRFDRFIQVIEALDGDQRAALALTKDRVAALTMLDELRGLFATGELAAARRLGERCFRDLHDAFGGSPVGEAKLKRPIVTTSAELAPLAERALATFLVDANEALGRVKQLLPLAADLGGGERAPHETRDDRGRRRAFESPEVSAQFLEKIELPVGVVHPATWPQVAKRLGCSIDEAKALIVAPERDNWEYEEDGPRPDGPRVLADSIGPDLLVRAIPVIPEDERPALYFPKRTAFGSDTEVRDPLSDAYASLKNRVARIDRLLELNAPAIIIDTDAAVLQRCVERLAACAATPLDIESMDGWGVRRAPQAVPLWNPSHFEMYRDPDVDDDEVEDTGTPSLVWLTDELVAIARQRTRVVSLREQRVVRTIETDGVQLQTCDDSGRYLITTMNSLMASNTGVLDGVGCFDLETDAWLDEMPAHVPAVSFGKDQPEDGILFEHRRGATFGLGCDRPTAMCWSRGNHYVWLSGDYGAIMEYGIRSTATCFEEVSADVLEARDRDTAPALLDDGTLTDDEVELEEPEREMYAAAPCAFAKTRAGWRLLTPNLRVADLERASFRLGFAIDAAGFSPDAKRLAVLVGEELRVIDIADRTIVSRVST